ncbi:MAG: hypothetical protein R6V57_11770, partial [Vicinamibacterales bacterium]
MKRAVSTIVLAGLVLLTGCSATEVGEAPSTPAPSYTEEPGWIEDYSDEDNEDAAQENSAEDAEEEPAQDADGDRRGTVGEPLVLDRGNGDTIVVTVLETKRFPRLVNDYGDLVYPGLFGVRVRIRNKGGKAWECGV